MFGQRTGSREPPQAPTLPLPTRPDFTGRHTCQPLKTRALGQITTHQPSCNTTRCTGPTRHHAHRPTLPTTHPPGRMCAIQPAPHLATCEMAPARPPWGSCTHRSPAAPSHHGCNPTGQESTFLAPAASTNHHTKPDAKRTPQDLTSLSQRSAANC